MTPAFAASVPLGRNGAALKKAHSSPRRTAVSASRIRRTQNVPGEFYVDTKCIDCNMCRWLAPATFARKDAQSAVHAQPSTAASELQALRAAAACPTSSIRTSTRNAGAAPAMRSFPLPAPGQTPGSEMRDIFFNGSATEPSFGCASWLLLHRGPDPMGIMVDVPRFSRPLLKSIEALAEPVGGVKYIFLTHRDDVFNHERWAEALPGVKRIIHRGDVRISQRTDECEVQLADEQLPFSLTEGCEILHVPGHTEGSLALLHRPTESIFTGDHLSYYARQGVITADPSICKHSWDEQIASVERLADVPFLHMYPGHGMHCHFDDAEDRMRKMRRATEFMRERFSSWDVASTKEWEQVGVLV